MLLEGHQLGRYRLLHQIGSGGMGTIFLAEDTHMPRQVAVKVVRTGDDMSHTHETTQRVLRSFQREMRAIVQLDHPHILPVFDFGQETIGTATYTYLVMLYRPEGSFADWLGNPEYASRLSLTDMALLLTQAAQALQHAHARGIVHQDVKPSNFLVRVASTRPEALPELLLADFGVACFSTTTTTQSQSHNVRGTPMFMSPEQWDGKPEPASDQYALGIMAFRLLTGRFPFQGTMGQVMRQHYMTPPSAPSLLNPQLTASIDQVILRALAKKPDQRFPDILAFADAFSEVVNQSEELRKVLITINTLDEGASASRSEHYPALNVASEAGKLASSALSQNLTQTDVPAYKHVSASAAPLEEATPKANRLQAVINDANALPLEKNEFAAGAHYLVANDDTTFIPPDRSTSASNAPTPPSLSDLANDDPTFIPSYRSGNINNDAQRTPAEAIAALATAQLPPATQATSTPNIDQSRTSPLSRRYSRLPKSLLLALLALVILAGSGILLYKGLIASNKNNASAQLSMITRSVNTPAGTVTVTIITTATHTSSQPATPTNGNTPVTGSTSAAGAGPYPTATATSGSAKPTATLPPTATAGPISQPTTAPTAAPPTPIPPTPTPAPGCTIASWSLNLRSQSNGSTVHYVTNYCSHTVSLRFTQAPRYTTDLQICFGSSNCTGWNSAPSSSVGVFIEFDSRVSTGAGFTVNARCHGGATCPAAYTVYGEARY